MYPSRAAARHSVAVDEIPDCGRGDRAAPLGSADVSDVPPVAGQYGRALRTDPGSTADHDCSVRKGSDERRNARNVARHRAGARETNSEKLAAARASTILRTPVLRILTNARNSNLKARSANSGPSSYWGAGDRAWNGLVRSNFWPAPALRWSAGSGPRSDRWQQADMALAALGTMQLNTSRCADDVLSRSAAADWKCSRARAPGVVAAQCFRAARTLHAPRSRRWIQVLNKHQQHQDWPDGRMPNDHS